MSKSAQEFQEFFEEQQRLCADEYRRFENDDYVGFDDFDWFEKMDNDHEFYEEMMLDNEHRAKDMNSARGFSF